MLHRIHPVKHVLERFELNINYSGDFCGLNKETNCHLFFHCMYSKLFWIDKTLFLKKVNVHALCSDILIYFENNPMNQKVIFLIQLFIDYGKLKLRSTVAKPSFDVLVFWPSRHAVDGKMASIALVSRPASVLPKISSE